MRELSEMMEMFHILLCLMFTQAYTHMSQGTTRPLPSSMRRTHHIVIFMARICYIKKKKKMQSKISKDKRHMGQHLGYTRSKLSSPLPVKSHRKLLIPAATNCDVYEVLSPREPLWRHSARIFTGSQSHRELLLGMYQNFRLPGKQMVSINCPVRI